MTPTELEDRIRTTYRTVVPDLVSTPAEVTPTVDDETVLAFDGLGRRARYWLRGGVAAAAAALLVGGWALAQRDPGAHPAETPTTSSVTQNPTTWMPSEVLPGWSLLSTEGDRLEQGRGLFVTDDGGRRAVALILLDGGFSDPGQFTDPIDLDGRKGFIAGAEQRFQVRVAIDSWGADIRSVGLTEQEVLDLARSLRLAPGDGEPGPGSLPEGFAPWTRIADEDITQLQTWWSGDRTLARLVVSRRPKALAAYVRAVAGPLEIRAVGADKVLVGGSARGRAPDPYDAWFGFPTAAFVERSGVGIALLGGDDGTLRERVVDVLVSMRPADPGTVDPTTPDQPRSIESMVTCDEPPADPLRVPFDGFQVVFFARGDAICVLEYEGNPPRMNSGSQLDSTAMDMWSGSISPHAYTMGLVPEEVASVVVERQDRSTLRVSTHAVAGIGARVWIAAISPADPVRALEYLDAGDAVIRRIGRPA